MSEEDEALTHFGVKGMKWGQRKNYSVSSESVTRVVPKSTKALVEIGTRKDPIFASSKQNTGIALVSGDLSTKARSQLSGVAAMALVFEGKKFNQVQREWNQIDKKYTDADLMERPKVKKYRNEMLDMYEKHANDGLPPGVKVKLVHVGDLMQSNGMRAIVGNDAGVKKGLKMYTGFRTDGVVRHADESPVFMTFDVNVETDGNRFKITGLGKEIKSETVEHADEVDPFLVHFGVKGMKWGQRKDPVFAASKKGSGIALVAGKELSLKEHAYLSSAAVNAMGFTGKANVKVMKDWHRIDSKYSDAELDTDAGYKKYRNEMFDMYEGHVNAKLPKGLKAKLLHDGPISQGGMLVVIGNESGLKQGIEVATASGNVVRHADEQPKFVTFKVNVETDGNRFKITGLGKETKSETVEHMSAVDNFLAHYGIKGMKWGVRGNKDGSGVIKVKARPTYTTEERRNASRNVKDAKKVGGRAIDRGGFDQARLAKMPTVERRIVNYMLGTKYTNAAAVATLVAGSVAIATTGGLPIPLIAASYGISTLASAHAGYKVFFQNMKQNPKLKFKTKLTADEMAKYSVGRDFKKHVTTKHGSLTISSMRGTRKLEIFDKEGRRVGGRVEDKTGKISDFTEGNGRVAFDKKP